MANRKTVLNIVHPYTYKQKDKTYVIGAVEEFRDRDKRVSEFVNSALNSTVRVLWHKMFDDYLGQMMREAGLKVDALFKFLFDTRVQSFNTTPSGVPIPDIKPDNISAENWDLLREVFISEQGLRKKVRSAENLLFIGGMLESCVSNSMGIFADKISANGEKLFYIPELCATYDPAQWQIVKPKLEQRKIQPISYSEAIALF